MKPAVRGAIGLGEAIQHVRYVGGLRLDHSLAIRRGPKARIGHEVFVGAEGSSPSGLIAERSSIRQEFPALWLSLRLASIIRSRTCLCTVGLTIGHHRFDAPVEVARHHIRRRDVDLRLRVRQPSPLPKQKMRRCSRKRPTIDLARILSDKPGLPGRRQQMPRTISSIFTPAWRPHRARR